MIINKTITIHRVSNENNFLLKNTKVLNEGAYKIGSAIGAVNAIMVKDQEMASYMSTIIGVSPNRDVWHEKLENYWNSISVLVPESGLPLNISFDFNVSLPESKELIEKNKSKIANATEFAKYVFENIPVDDYWKYGKPVVVKDFALWRYVINYKSVANNIDDVNKSKGIRFYIVDESYMKERNKQRYQIRSQAKEMFAEISDNFDKLREVLYATGRAYMVTDIADDYSVGIAVESICDSEPELLIRVLGDKDLSVRSFIEKAIDLNILNRVVNSTIIVNTATGDTIGNTMDEAVKYLSAAENLKLKDDIEKAIKATPKSSN